MSVLHVLGLGDSIQHYRPQEGIDAMGVNDIWKYIPVQMLLCVDPKKRFTPERLQIIESSSPVRFYSQLEEWSHMPGFERIQLKQWEGKLNSAVPYSNNSPFVAASLGFQLGYKEIILFGVDFNTHKLVNTAESKEKILNDFNSLNQAMALKGASLKVGRPDSLLSQVLNVQKKKKSN